MDQYISKFTHGGIPIADAWHWDKRTYQMLGNVLYLLTSGQPEKRRLACIDYYALKRNFSAIEFDECITRLDAYRKEHGFKAIREIIEVASQEMTSNILQDIPGETCCLPDITDLNNQIHTIDNRTKRDQLSLKNKIECEQMSLF